MGYLVYKIDLVNGENNHKPQEKLPESEPASETVPDRNHTDAQNHENSKGYERPTDDPCAIEQFLFPWLDHSLCLLWSRSKEFLFLDKSNRGQQHQRDCRTENDGEEYGQQHGVILRIAI